MNTANSTKQYQITWTIPSIVDDEPIKLTDKCLFSSEETARECAEAWHKTHPEQTYEIKPV